MGNKARNAEAVHIHRPLVTGQARGMSITEVVITSIVNIVFGEDLFPHLQPDKMWKGRSK